MVTCGGLAGGAAEGRGTVGGGGATEGRGTVGGGTMVGARGRAGGGAADSTDQKTGAGNACEEAASVSRLAARQGVFFNSALAGCDFCRGS